MILKGDCIEVMKAMKPNSVDAIVTDPPYGLEFMGKEWDKLASDWNKGDPAKGYDGDGGLIRWTKPRPRYHAGFSMQLWHIQWLTEAYRVLKSGGSMLVMGGTRTFHRLACAIEDSGFIIKDTLMWLYGSGFPKAQDLGKMIDKRNGQNEGLRKQLALYLRRAIKKRGITLKAIRIQLNYKMKGGGLIPHWITENSQPIFPPRKDWLKLKEILNLDNKWDWLMERDEAEREKIANGMSGKTAIWNEKGEMGNFDITAPSTDLAKHWDGFKVGGIKPAYEPIIWAVKPPEGSYVDNVLKWGVGAVNVDETRIEAKLSQLEIRKNYTKNRPCKDKAGFAFRGKVGTEPNNKGRFPANVILDEEAGKMLDEQSGERKSAGNYLQKDRINKIFNSETKNVSQYNLYSDNGGASRFFYRAKASRGERNAGLEGMEKKECFNLGHKDNPGRNAPKKSYPRQNNHPTVKPIKLFEYLIKLVTREGQIVLDPFIGSGTTAIAAHNVGRKCVGIEKEDEYLTIAKRRIDHWKNQPKQMEIGL